MEQSWAAVAEQIRKDKEAERATLGIKDKPQKMAQVKPCRASKRHGFSSIRSSAL